MSFDDDGLEYRLYRDKAREYMKYSVDEYNPYRKSIAALLGSGVINLLSNKRNDLGLVWCAHEYYKREYEPTWSWETPISYIKKHTSYQPADIAITVAHQEEIALPDIISTSEVNDFSYIENIDRKGARDLSAFCLMLFNKNTGIFGHPHWNEVRILARPSGDIAIGYQTGIFNNSKVRYRLLDMDNADKDLSKAINFPIKISHPITTSDDKSSILNRATAV